MLLTPSIPHNLKGQALRSTDTLLENKEPYMRSYLGHTRGPSNRTFLSPLHDPLVILSHRTLSLGTMGDRQTTSDGGLDTEGRGRPGTPALTLPGRGTPVTVESDTKPDGRRPSPLGVDGVTVGR